MRESEERRDRSKDLRMGRRGKMGKEKMREEVKRKYRRLGQWRREKKR